MAKDVISLVLSGYKDYQRQSLIQANQRKSKVGDTVYSLNYVDFNATTRAAKVTFECTKQYRTVERYVTRNHQRYPVYSDWKYKTTTIKKTVRLTNENLEALNQHEDDLIRDFAAEIIVNLENEDLIPSWLHKEWLHIWWKDGKAALNDDKGRIKQEHKKAVAQASNEIKALQDTLRKTEKKRKKPGNRLNRIIRKIERMRTRKHSAKREERLTKKQEKWERICAEFEVKMNSLLSEIQTIERQIVALDEAFKTETQKIDDKIHALYQECTANERQIKALPITFQQDNTFIPLKTFIGMKYEKIVGCYIIHNTENNKYYVGQSKDVIKRIKSHFRGTVPNNIIFAEDYFSSKFENKDDLFSVKVIRLQTKDELDATEREMIEYYDAYCQGYNGTSGNI